MPGPHPPPHMPMPRRQPNEYHYGMPPPAQSPVHGMYMGYPPQPPYHAHPHPQSYPQHWQYAAYPQQYPPQQHMRPYHHQPQQHIAQPLPQQNPIVVSSHPNGLPVAPIPRAAMQTPVVQSPIPPPVPLTHALPPKPQMVSPPTPDASVPMSPRPVSSPQVVTIPTAAPASATLYMPNFPKLPWLSVPDQDFPTRPSRRRRRRNVVQESDKSLQLPERPSNQTAKPTVDRSESQTSTVVASESATPATSQAPSEVDSTNPTTPSSTVPTVATPRAAPAVPAHSRTSTRTAIPIIPVTPAIPNIPQKSRKASEASQAPQLLREKPDTASTVVSTPPSESTITELASPTEQTSVPASEAKAVPKSWADLVRAKSTPSAAAAVQPATNGAHLNGISAGNAGALGEVLRLYSVDAEHKIPFLEPRGLVNTGNMCYMNSILQVLLYSTPFYDFLDQIGKRALHSFKSDTPLLDSMIEFMREFKVIDSTVSASQLRLRLKEHEFEQFGSAFTPEYVYDAIKRVPRFSSMKRGHQQDAEEFLGFLLDTLHEECARVISNSSQKSTRSSSVSTTQSQPDTDESDWLEVGPKQKSSVTRTSGPALANSPPTPISKIFSGHLRSELRVHGLKTSVTLEPFQPLQLDIQAPHINTITDALRGLTKPETLSGDWGSPRGVRTATKQVFIEHLPPVLLLHLKRFSFDRPASSPTAPSDTHGARKIWKSIKYPLDLEIPREVLAPSRRAALGARVGNTGLRYQLVSVVYHHGKHAGGGHYTADVRRQDGKDWVRIDDTVVRRITAEDVVGTDSEEPSESAQKGGAKGKHDEAQRSANFFEQGMLPEDGGEGEEKWEDVQTNGVGAQGQTPTGMRWAEKVNVTGPGERPGVKEGKVAYILFYQQVKD
ncbi:cysteine proteinase [Eremomyces bilateralis CBS 781.70]|uniref:Ubiquitin carboxyl-terminal hydrolase n=1 Tax=Eremomyces bilateralis CBS 781.70 TaxID=1392243 RepID=A0A6G1FWP3_9PEZI|nr:cysteine proteinase [Eremomyces bilateralis CBS 781.70]KAF1810122.1 cysteine proteinase [Eremomyces bilateralis CBS 781.70]